MNRIEHLAKKFESQLPALLSILNPTSDEDPMSDLSIPQLRFMRAIADCDRTPSELMEILGSSASSISQIANRLEESGLVQRSADVSDRRRTHISLTDTGRRLFQSRREIRLERTERALERLEPDERESLVRFMDRMIGHGVVPVLLDMEISN